MPRVLVLVLGLVLSGCAAGARPDAMTIDRSDVEVPPSFDQTFAVASIGGGEETNPLWTSEVSSDAFRSALTMSLSNVGLLNPASDRRIVAVMEELDQPLIGFSMTVTSTVNYRVVGPLDDVQFEQRIVAPYTAAFSDSLYGVERLRLANEGSIRANITAFMKALLASFTAPREPEVSMACCFK